MEFVKKERIEYIDAMRGFTMLLVVYCHVLSMGYEPDILETDSFNDLFLLVRMPLFFFVSGFILYKKDAIWNISTSIVFLKKKFLIQIIPTAFFFLLYVYIFNANLTYLIYDRVKGGFWFTLALFEFFVLYTILNNLFRTCHLSVKLQSWAFLCAGLFVYVFSSPLYNGMPEDMASLLGIIQTRYFLFFIVGVLAKKHFHLFEKILDNSYIIGSIILSFFLIAFYYLKHDSYEHPAIKHVYFIILGVLGLIVIFSFFRKYQERFTQQHYIGRALQYIGRRTLDLYLLHFFFLPDNLQMVGTFFAKHPNPTLEFFLSLTLAILIIGLCLVMSNIIRISNVLGHYLFGAKI